MRLIDADVLKKSVIEPSIYDINTTDFLSIISEQPTVESLSVVHGKWELFGDDDDTGMSYWCTACNFHLSEDLFYSSYKDGKWISNGVFKYCPKCGTKMDIK